MISEEINYTNIKIKLPILYRRVKSKKKERNYRQSEIYSSIISYTYKERTPYHMYYQEEKKKHSEQ